MDLDQTFAAPPETERLIVEAELVEKNGELWGRVEGSAALWGPVAGNAEVGATVVLALAQDGTPYIVYPAVGAVGPQGPEGPPGPTGPAGPQGATGATGTAGTPGEKWYTGAGAPPGATGIVGDWWLDSASGDYYEKTGASAWTLRGNLKGPTGATGATGSTGAQGPQGVPGTPPQRVTALPGSPTDGQEVVYVADAASGVLWHLRYNAGSASPYKWEFVGGSALAAEVVGASAISSTSYADAPAPTGPSIAIPLAGDYDLAWGHTVWGNPSGAAVALYSSPAFGATQAVDADAVIAQFQTTGSSVQTPSRETRKVISAPLTVALRYRMGSAGGSLNVERRRLRANPVRVG